MFKHEKKGKLVIISGFSGVGKGTVVQRLNEDFSHYALSVSMTTRPPRVISEVGRCTNTREKAN